MNNEPVAWMSPDGKVCDTEGKLFYIPLYTHPVKELFKDESFERTASGNSVLVPSDKLAEMQAEIKGLKAKLDKAIDAEKDRRF